MEDTMRFGHLMEAALYITESEGKLFDTLIKLDFQQAVREQEGDGADEETKEKIEKENNLKSKFTAENAKNKIQEIIAKAKATIAKAVETIINKILGFIKADSKIVKRYKEIIAKADLSKFPGISNFSLPTGYPGVDKLQQLHDSVLITDNAGKEKEIYDEAEAYMKEFIPANEDLWKPTSGSDLNKAIEALGESSTIISTLRSCKLHDRLAIPTNKIDKILYKKSGNGDDSAKEMHAENIDMITAGCKVGIKLANIYLNGCIEIFKRYRKAVLSVGAFAAKQQINTKNNIEESVEALVYIVGESSDMAIDEAFAY